MIMVGKIFFIRRDRNAWKIYHYEATVFTRMILCFQVSYGTREASVVMSQTMNCNRLLILMIAHYLIITPVMNVNNIALISLTVGVVLSIVTMNASGLQLLNVKQSKPTDLTEEVQHKNLVSRGQYIFILL